MNAAKPGRRVGAAAGGILLAATAFALSTTPARASTVAATCDGLTVGAAQAAGYVVHDFRGAQPAFLLAPPGQHDFVLGSDVADIIDTGDHDDIVCSFGGADTVYGGTAHDRIFLGSGSDYAEGGSGSDFVSGGRDSDEIHGDGILGDLPTDGRDTLQGGEDNDDLYGGSKADSIDGGSTGFDDDFADGGDGGDTCTEIEQAPVSC